MSTSKIVMKIVSISFSILVVVLVIFALFRVGTYAYDFGYRVFTEQPVAKAPGKDVVVQITDDMSSTDIAATLEDKGLVQDAALFHVQLKLSAYANKIRPGIYTLNTSMTAKEMMQVMAAVEESTETETEAVKQESTETETEKTTETETTVGGPDAA